MGYRIVFDETGNWIAAHGESFPPASVSIPLNTRFYRTDVRELYYWNGSSWVRDPADLPGGSSLTVQEVDGSPSVASVSTLQFDQADGFVVSDVGGNVARVDLDGIPQAKVSSLVSDLAGKEATGVAAGLVAAHEAAADPHTGYQRESEKGVAGGYASLDGAGTVPDAQIPAAIARDAEVTTAISNHEGAADPHTGYQKESEKNAAGGYAGLDGSSKLTGSQQAYGTLANTACEGNDARLSDARTPLAHKASHQDGGSDEIDVTGLAGLLVDAQKVEVADEGTLAGTRKRLNFTGAGVTATDDAGNNRVNVSIPGGAGASWTLHEQNLGGVGSESWRGKFTITDAAISPSSKVVIVQAPGPYTGKGTRADEAEMDPLWCIAESGSGQATVYWRAMAGIAHDFADMRGVQPVGGAATQLWAGPMPSLVQRTLGRVRGNVKFLYTVA